MIWKPPYHGRAVYPPHVLRRYLFDGFGQSCHEAIRGEHLVGANVSWGGSSHGRAAVFNGSTSYLNAASSVLSGSSSYAIETCSYGSTGCAVCIRQNTGTTTAIFLFPHQNASGTSGCWLVINGTVQSLNIAGLQDGAIHHLIYSRSGTQHAIWIDGVLRGTGTDSDVVATNNVTIGGHHPTGSFDFNGGIALVTLYSRALSESEIRDRFADPYSWERKALRNRIEASSSPFVGYQLYLAQGRSPDPDSDPVIASSQDDSLAIDVSALSLAAHKNYVGAIVPVNAVGRGPAAEFSFKTDGDGMPALTPTPVHSVTARALSGGRVEVKWQYDELHPLAAATAFTFELLYDRPGEIPFFPFDEVKYTPPKRHYQHTLVGLDDGPLRIRVFARRGTLLSGVAETNVNGPLVQVDGTPPPSVAMAMTAE